MLQEVPCSLLQMVLLRKSLRPRLLLVSVVPLLPLGEKVQVQKTSVSKVGEKGEKEIL